MCAQRKRRSACASAQSDQSLRCALNKIKDPSFHHADSEDSDRNGRVFAARTGHFVCFVILRLIFVHLSRVHSNLSLWQGRRGESVQNLT